MPGMAAVLAHVGARPSAHVSGEPVVPERPMIDAIPAAPPRSPGGIPAAHPAGRPAPAPVEAGVLVS